MNTKLIMIEGLPGSGKSTLAIKNSELLPEPRPECFGVYGRDLSPRRFGVDCVHS